jgi:hypothetical protein
MLSKYEQVLIPRFKVVANYPGNTSFRVGEIITVDNKAIEKEFAVYPAIFRRLKWWEDRDQEDMPEYVKFTKMYASFTKGEVFKWKTWDTSNDTDLIVQFVNWKKKGAQFDKSAVPGGDHVVPATKEEFDAQFKKEVVD